MTSRISSGCRVDKFYDTGREMPQDADYLWLSMLFPFTLPYLTTGPAKPQIVLPSQPLGLLLTRPTAALLANASPPVGDAYWKAELGDRVVYIDVPHGAVTIGESFQLRALFARRLQSDQNSQIMIIGLVVIVVRSGHTGGCLPCSNGTVVSFPLWTRSSGR